MGEGPFTPKQNIDDLFFEIIGREIEIPSNLSSSFQDFLRQLFRKDPRKRLGAHGIDEILNHSWLKDAPREAPISISYLSIEKAVTKLSSDTDTHILIDSKNWFSPQKRLVRRNTYLDGFSFHSKDHEEIFTLKHLLSEEESNKKSAFCVTKGPATLSTASHLNSKATTLDKIDHQPKRNPFSANELFECDLSPVLDDQEATIGPDEIVESEPQALYDFAPHSSLKK